MDRKDIFYNITQDIDHILRRPYGVAPWSKHEFYGILLESVDTLWEMLKNKAPDSMIEAQAIHVAAVIASYLETK